MFEKFTQKAIDVVQSAQNYAVEYSHKRVLPQHLLIGLVAQTKGVQAKILGFDKINFGELSTEVASSCEIEPKKEGNKVIYFSSQAQEILKYAVQLSAELNSKFIMPQHIALALFSKKDTGAYKILQKFDIDEEKIVSNLKRILDKSSAFLSSNSSCVMIPASSSSLIFLMVSNCARNTL